MYSLNNLECQVKLFLYGEQAQSFVSLFQRDEISLKRLNNAFRFFLSNKKLGKNSTFASSTSTYEVQPRLPKSACIRHTTAERLL